MPDSPAALFDRIAIAFGCAIAGACTGLFVWFWSIVFPFPPSEWFTGLVIGFAVVFGVVGFLLPNASTDWIGKMWSWLHKTFKELADSWAA